MTTFIRRISAVSNAIQTIDNEANDLIIYCLNCIRHGRNATYEPGLRSMEVYEALKVKKKNNLDNAIEIETVKNEDQRKTSI